jgi:hypothetical protein
MRAIALRKTEPVLLAVSGIRASKHREETMQRKAVLAALVLGFACLAPGSTSGVGPAVRISVFVRFAPRADRQAVRALVASHGARVRYEYTLLPDLINVRGFPEAAVWALERAPGVLEVAPDRAFDLDLAQSVPLIQATAAQIGSIDADGLVETGALTRVCVVDTGVDNTFAGYKDRIVAQCDFANDDRSADDDRNHGKHVAAVIASADPTYKGVAPKALLMAAKVFRASGSGDESDILAGIDWCANLGEASYTAPAFCPNGLQPQARPAHVINLSLGGGAFSGACDGDTLASKANAAAAKGIVVVASSGNDCLKSSMGTPACASGVIAVGATYDAPISGTFLTGNGNCCTESNPVTDQVACYSDASSMLDHLAPGSVISTNLSVSGVFGTSFAAPHTSGVAALLLQRGRALTPAQVASAMNTTLDPVVRGVSTERGRLNARRALATLPSPCLPDGTCGAGEARACCADIGCDGDADGAYGDCDNCPAVSNPSQGDFNRDGPGDACSDVDGDGDLDANDNCIMVSNPSQVNSDADGPSLRNPDQTDTDGDRIGDVCDICPDGPCPAPEPGGPTPNPQPIDDPPGPRKIVG